MVSWAPYFRVAVRWKVSEISFLLHRRQCFKGLYRISPRENSRRTHTPYVEKILTSAWELILIGIFCGFGNPKKSSQIRRNLLRICKLRKILRKSAESCGFERTAFSNPQKITFIHENANTRNFAMNNSHPKKILEFEKILSACNSWLCYGHLLAIYVYNLFGSKRSCITYNWKIMNKL